MEQEPLQQLIQRSIENSVIDGHSVDQDGSNVLIVGDELYYCTDEGVRSFLASRAEQPTAAPQRGCEQSDAEDDQSPRGSDNAYGTGGEDRAPSGPDRSGALNPDTPVAACRSSVLSSARVRVIA